MPRLKPRFRISVKDYRTGKTLLVELVDQPFPGSRRYWLRVDGRNATRLSEASLTTVFRRLRSWLVKQRRHSSPVYATNPRRSGRQENALSQRTPKRTPKG
jgi:hypothetical protein